MAEFSTKALLEIELDQRSLRSAQEEIEERLGADPIDVEVTGGPGGGRGGKSPVPDLLGEGLSLDTERNELLEEMLEAVDDAEFGGGDGVGTGFLIGRLAGPASGAAGGAAGGVLGGLGGGALGGMLGGGGGGQGLLGRLLTSSALSPGSPLFFGKGGLLEGFESPESKKQAQENAQSFRQLLGLEEGQAFPGFDEAVGDLSQSLSGFGWPDLPDFSWPDLPDFSWPDLPSFSWPSLPSGLTGFSWPSLPNGLTNFSWPQLPTLQVESPGWAQGLDFNPFDGKSGKSSGGGFDGKGTGSDIFSPTRSGGGTQIGANTNKASEMRNQQTKVEVNSTVNVNGHDAKKVERKMKSEAENVRRKLERQFKQGRL